MEKRRPPRAVLLPRVQRSPFCWTYHPPRPFRAAGGQSLNTDKTAAGCSVQTPPDMAAPRIEAIRYENKRPRPTNRERPKRRRERRGCSIHTARPNIDNVDNMDTDGRRVEAIPHEQEKQTAPNMDNVDNRTQTRPPCGEEEAAPAPFFCPCAAFALSFDVSQARPLFVQWEAKARKQPPAPPRGAASTEPARI